MNSSQTPYYRLSVGVQSSIVFQTIIERILDGSVVYIIRSKEPVVGFHTLASYIWEGDARPRLLHV